VDFRSTSNKHLTASSSRSFCWIPWAGKTTRSVFLRCRGHHFHRRAMVARHQIRETMRNVVWQRRHPRTTALGGRIDLARYLVTAIAGSQSGFFPISSGNYEAGKGSSRCERSFWQADGHGGRKSHQAGLCSPSSGLPGHESIVIVCAALDHRRRSPDSAEGKQPPKRFLAKAGNSSVGPEKLWTRKHANFFKVFRARKMQPGESCAS